MGSLLYSWHNNILSLSSNLLFPTLKKKNQKAQREILSANHQEFCIHSIVLWEAYCCQLNGFLPIKLKLSFLSPKVSWTVIGCCIMVQCCVMQLQQLYTRLINRSLITGSSNHFSLECFCFLGVTTSLLWWHGDHNKSNRL